MRQLFSNKWIYYIEKHRVTSSVIKMTFFAHRGISIKLFVIYNLHIINECLSFKFHPYSILTGYTKVESVAYQVLISKFIWNTKMPKVKILQLLIVSKIILSNAFIIGWIIRLYYDLAQDDPILPKLCGLSCQTNFDLCDIQRLPGTVDILQDNKLLAHFFCIFNSFLAGLGRN